MPPPKLDGARVLWSAWAGGTPFGELPGAAEPDRWVYGLAVWRYDEGPVYRFTCNRLRADVQEIRSFGGGKR